MPARLRPVSRSYRSRRGSSSSGWSRRFGSYQLHPERSCRHICLVRRAWGEPWSSLPQRICVGMPLQIYCLSISLMNVPGYSHCHRNLGSYRSNKRPHPTLARPHCHLIGLVSPQFLFHTHILSSFFFNSAGAIWGFAVNGRKCHYQFQRVSDPH